MFRTTFGRIAAVGVFVGGVAALIVAAGPLNPPAGAVASSYKTLTEVEPRIAISAANTPGNATSTFVISQPGSYYLTGNVTGESGKCGVRITADHVTLDLNGFQVVGVAGALVGVGDDGSSTRVGITVRNGIVRNWPGGGVRFSRFGGSRLHHYNGLTLRSNGVGTTGAGLECRDSAVVVNCEASGNLGGGFIVTDGCLAQNCTSFQNTGSGFEAGFGAQISNCVSRDNTGAGFQASGDSLFSGCAAMINDLDGFNVIRATLNACQASFNTGVGFVGGSGSSFTDCNAANNTAGGISVSTSTVRGCQVIAGVYGIRVSGSDSRIEDNNVSAATTGFEVIGSGNFIIKNTASGGTTRYSIGGTNTVGPIVTATGIITSTVPTANFEY